MSDSTASDPAATGYYYLDGEQPVGPFTLDTLAQMVRRRLLSADVPVAADGSAEWQPLSNLVVVPMLPVELSSVAATPGPTVTTEAAEDKPLARHLCEGLLKLLDRLPACPPCRVRPCGGWPKSCSAPTPKPRPTPCSRGAS